MPINLLWDNTADVERRKRAQAADELLNRTVTTTGSMLSSEFDERGNPVDVRIQRQLDPRREQVSLLDQPMDAGQISKVSLGLANAGYDPSQINQILQPQLLQQKEQAVQAARPQGMGIFQDPNQYASQLTDLSDRQFKATQPFQQAALGYNQIKGLMTDEQGQPIPLKDLPGTFDLALQRNTIKAMSVLKPEAYMQDDAVQAFMASQNIGDFAQLKNYFMGDIKLDEDGRRKMLKAYNSIMKDNFQAMESVSQPFERQREALFPNTPRETLFGAPIGQYGSGLIIPPPGFVED